MWSAGEREKKWRSDRRYISGVKETEKEEKGSDDLYTVQSLSQYLTLQMINTVQFE